MGKSFYPVAIKLYRIFFEMSRSNEKKTDFYGVPTEKSHSGGRMVNWSRGCFCRKKLAHFPFGLEKRLRRM